MVSYCVIPLCFWIFTAITIFYPVSCSENQIRLFQRFHEIRHLKSIRPVFNDSEKVNVTFGLTLSQIVELDVKQQVLTLNVWVKQVWNNPYLKWNKSEYGGLDSISVNAKDIWLPDITLYNNAQEADLPMDKVSTSVIVDSDGYCTWLAPSMIHSKCVVDIKHFPFDSQHCKLKFGSWIYGDDKLNLLSQGTGVDLSKNIRHVQWKLFSMKVSKSLVKYSCCPTSYHHVIYTIVMKRRSLFYLVNLIAPLVVISFLACLTFILPFESGERVSLSVTVLLSMTVFMLLVQNMIPPTSDSIPLITKFYTAAGFEIAVAVVISCYNLRLYHKNETTEELPKWMKVVFIGKLSKWLNINSSKPIDISENFQDHIPSKGDSAMVDMQSLLSVSSTADEGIRELEILMDDGIKEHEFEWCYDGVEENGESFKTNKKAGVRNHNKNKQKQRSKNNNNNLEKSHNSIDAQFHYNDNDDLYYHVICDNQSKLTDENKRFENNNSLHIIQKLKDISQNITNLVKIEENKNFEKAKENQWKIVAMTLDKIFFYLFMLIFLLTSVLVFMQIPEYVP